MRQDDDILVPDAESKLEELDNPLSDVMRAIEEKATRETEISRPVRPIPFGREDSDAAGEASRGEHPPGTPPDAVPLRGVCNVCGWKGEFRRPERGREGHFCGNCASTSRHRMVVQGLAMVLKMSGHLPVGGHAPIYCWPRDQHLSILEPSGRGAYPSMLEDRFQYTGIEYDPSRVDPDHPRRGYGDIQRLHYQDESYDVVIASDVFEHVRDDETGFREILRVLRPGGALVLTVPYEHEQAETIARVNTSGPTDVYLLPPMYHSGGGQTLVYRDYGRDLLRKLRRIGFSVLHVDGGDYDHGITRQSLILAIKQDFVEWVHEGFGVAWVVDASIPAGSRGHADAKGHPSTVPCIGPLLHQRLYLLVKFNLRGLGGLLRKCLGR